MHMGGWVTGWPGVVSGWLGEREDIRFGKGLNPPPGPRNAIRGLAPGPRFVAGAVSAQAP